MTTAIGTNPYSAAGTAYGSQTASTAAATKAGDTGGNPAGSATNSGDTVELSDAAKAYLASQSTDAAMWKPLGCA